jgi:hypothetical protein
MLTPEQEIDYLNRNVAHLRRELRGIKLLIQDMDMQSEQLTEEVNGKSAIHAYVFNTGAWHRLLGWCAGASLPAYIQQQLEIGSEPPAIGDAYSNSYRLEDEERLR